MARAARHTSGWIWSFAYTFALVVTVLFNSWIFMILEGSLAHQFGWPLLSFWTVVGLMFMVEALGTVFTFNHTIAMLRSNGEFDD